MICCSFKKKLQTPELRVTLKQGEKSHDNKTFVIKIANRGASPLEVDTLWFGWVGGEIQLPESLIEDFPVKIEPGSACRLTFTESNLEPILVGAVLLLKMEGNLEFWPGVEDVLGTIHYSDKHFELSINSKANPLWAKMAAMRGNIKEFLEDLGTSSVCKVHSS